MAQIRCLLLGVLLTAYVNSGAQNIYYPAGASQLLQSTANDVAALFEKAIPGAHPTVQAYTEMPARGIILQYDGSNQPNQSCSVQSDGQTYIRFSAPEDNGINYGVYEYLYQIGFRFYQPGTAWEIIPALNSPYKALDTTYSCRFRYKNWFISGGCNTWAMDNNGSYYWDTYYGENGHQWSLYQRRNNMTGGYRFTGHRDDILTADYLAALQSNPCYVAPFNGSRAATRQSVPDISQPAAIQLWSDAIENQYRQLQGRILGNSSIYPNQFHNFSYFNGSIGIEVPDGARWGNSTDNSGGCGNGPLLRPSDQQFTLANETVNKISNRFPGKRFQLYAYDSHADVPASNITLNPLIDVQVVPTAFQTETSPKALLQRWYGRYSHISEYHYLNIAQWSGENPSVVLNDLKQTVQRLQEKQSDGIVWEAAPSKFASLPFLRAANLALKNNAAIDAQLNEFCTQLFGDAAPFIKELLQAWGSDAVVTNGDHLPDNRYKLPYYFSLVQQADARTASAPTVVKQRIQELKAYLHYMVLYYDWTSDQRAAGSKVSKAAALCDYLARINRLQVVNSYFLINDVVNRYPSGSDFYNRFNTANGTAYQDGQLPLITGTAIDSLFAIDYRQQSAMIQQHSFEDAASISSRVAAAGFQPLPVINVFMNYTYAKDYAARSEFYFIADKAGSVSIRYTPKFDIPGKGFINFSVEDINKPLGVIKDFTLDGNAGAGSLTVAVPAAGTYKLSINSKYKSALQLSIATNGNLFFKNGPFLGNTIENYRGDLSSLPGSFYVPAGLNKLYFSINNSNPGGAGFATVEAISNSFGFRDNMGNPVMAKLAGNGDSALYYLDIPGGSDGSFWQAAKMEQYRLCFANTSNYYWYVQKSNCSALDFNIRIRRQNNACIPYASTTAAANGLKWEVYDAGQWQYYSNSNNLELPETLSPNAIIRLSNGSCMVTKKPAADPVFISQKSECASGAAAPVNDLKLTVYPNPGTGIFNCRLNGMPVIADAIAVFDATGKQVARFSQTQQFNISQLPPALYFYRLTTGNKTYHDKLIKL